MLPEVKIPAGLPKTDPESIIHSARVRDYIFSKIDLAGGSISFSEYMHDALYAPGLGYYVAGMTKFGRNGDFVTAPEVSHLYGRVLANQCAQILDSIPNSSILEVGAGTGILAITILKKLGEIGQLPSSYKILEVSPDLIERQRKNISMEVPEFNSVVTWIDTLPADFEGVILANEVADALPFERFIRTKSDVLEVSVTYSDKNFIYQMRPAKDQLKESVLNIENQLDARLAEGYSSEVSLTLEAWGRDLITSLNHGILLVLDYGLGMRDYYHSERDQGWIRCHYRHHAHEEPLIFPGIQDITSWVNFSILARVAIQCGAKISGFTNQSNFLINSGLEKEFVNFKHLSTRDQLTLSKEIKVLTLPSEMGENFKCLGIQKGNLPVINAFSNGNRSHIL